MTDKKLKAFISMPYNPEWTDAVFKIIEEQCNKLNISATKINSKVLTGDIVEAIFNEIDTSDMVIVDLTGNNPNVCAEAGYAIKHFGVKNMIFLNQNPSQSSFIFRNINQIKYMKPKNLRISDLLQSPGTSETNDAIQNKSFKKNLAEHLKLITQKLRRKSRI